MSVENNPRRFLYESLYDHVLDEIRAGRLSMGDRVPSEMELAISSASAASPPRKPCKR